MRILGIDPGEKRIGLAISDDLGIAANPLGVILHTNRQADVESILKIARDSGVERIVIGHSLDDEGNLTPSARKAIRLADEIRLLTDIPVIMVDEYGSTNEARSAAIEMGVPRGRRKGHRDSIAALIILQRYLDSTT
jgi:putative Holliday junction resolvase